MRYVFFGGQESEFAQIVLDKLIEAGMAPIKTFRNAKEIINLKELEELSADFFLVASFAKILKKELIQIPPKGVVCVHPSLLPKYRGASPIQSAILNGETETGTSLFLIDEKVDHGLIVATDNLKLAADDNFKSLSRKLAELSAELAIKTLPKWVVGKIQPQIQDEAKVTYTKKFVTEDAQVNLETDSPKSVCLKIRALNPEPGVFTILKLKDNRQLRLKLLSAELNGETLRLITVQPEGKKPMAFDAFLNGYKKLLQNSTP